MSVYSLEENAPKTSDFSKKRPKKIALNYEFHHSKEKERKKLKDPNRRFTFRTAVTSDNLQSKCNHMPNGNVARVPSLTLGGAQ